jgi:hypothetical protein
LFLHPKKTFSEFICGRWYSSTGDDLKNAFSRSTIQFFLLYNSPFSWLKVTNNKQTLNWCEKLKKIWFFVDYRRNGCLISSLADNWDLDEFFERFICGRWYIHLEQTIYHLCRPIIILSGWLSTPVVDYDLQWLNMISSGWL